VPSGIPPSTGNGPKQRYIFESLSTVSNGIESHRLF
jgi:hypothetical protein